MLLSAQASALIEIAVPENVAKWYAYITAKATVDIYPRHPFYIAIANFGKFVVNLLKHQQVL